MEDVFSHDSEEQPPVFCMQMANFSHLQASSSGPKLRSVPYSLRPRKCPPLSAVYSGASLSQSRPLLLCMAPCWSLGCRETQADKLSVPSQSGQPKASQQCTEAIPAEGWWLHSRKDTAAATAQERHLGRSQQSLQEELRLLQRPRG